jgi:3-deoxy-D-manno-octulosonate 8-phosphate phosphatase (KDO 8-P phosphatase)
MSYPRDVLITASAVELLILDVDGVMTDGRLYYSNDGAEAKAFHVQDGFALKMLMNVGIPVAIVTGRTSNLVERRAEELGIPHIYQGLADKGEVIQPLCAATGIAAERFAHAGDDIPDLALFDKVGVRFSVPGAHPTVAARAHYVTLSAPGFGAVREICHLIMIARDLWHTAPDSQ